MIEELDRLIDEITSLNSKLILLIGPPRCGKSSLLARLSARRNAPVLNVGAVLGRRLLATPGPRRHLRAADLLTDVVDETGRHDPLLLDNIELLFDRTLHLDPLGLLKRHARVRRVVAVWPGECRKNRLYHAATGHPEHQDYGIDGLVPFAVH